MNLPSIWRAFTISCILEEIIIEVWGNFIIVHNPPSLWLIFEWAFEQVQWTIIFIVKKVFKIVFKRNPKLTSGIILSNFEFKIFEISIEILMCPSLFNVPMIAATYNIRILTFDNNSLIWPLILFDEFFNSKGFCVNPINVTGAITQLHGSISLIILFLSPFFQLDIPYSNTSRYDLSFFLTY
jgi:hypothetical protein